MASAKALYYLYSDLDAADYLETYEQDIVFIATLIQEIGYRSTKALLEEMTA